MPTFPSRHSLSRTPRCHRARPCLEALESRLAPATLVNPTTLTYQDSDGDHVTVSFSKPILTADNVNTLFTFSSGASAVNGSNAAREQLRKIDLTSVAGAAGTTITTTATRSRATVGDGLAALGEIDATGLDLGAVVIDGDLGRILAGDATTTTSGLAGLTAHSLGRYGTDTGAADLHSVIQGQLDSLSIKSDVKEAYLDVQGGADGSIGRITIGGSLLGTGLYGGCIQASGDIGNVRVGGQVAGGAGYLSGNISANGGNMGTVTIGGSLQGGAGRESGKIFANGSMGAVKITGSVVGAAGLESGYLIAYTGSLASVTIRGSMLGSSGDFSGTIYCGDALGAVKVGGDVQGGAGMRTGEIFGSSSLASVTVGGSLLAGTGSYGSGDISSGMLGPVKITGSVTGGLGQYTGGIFSDGPLASVTIGGSLVGGSGSPSGTIYAGGVLGAVKITGDVVGGSATGTDNLEQSGYITAQRIPRLTIGGKLSAGTNTTSGKFVNNGAIQVAEDLGVVRIGNIVGNATNPAIVSAHGQAVPTTTDVAIGSLIVKGGVEYGQILAGFDLAGTPNNADAQVGRVKVADNWVASSLVAGATAGTDGLFGDSDDAAIAGGNPAISSRIGSVVIGGQVLGTQGGGDHFGIVVQNVVSLRIGGTLIPLKAGNSNDDLQLLLATTGDFGVHEV
jgi:hypothetical protein